MPEIPILIELFLTFAKIGLFTLREDGLFHFREYSSISKHI